MSKYQGPKQDNCGTIGGDVNLPELDLNTGLAWLHEIHNNVTQFYPWLHDEYQQFPAGEMSILRFHSGIFYQDSE